ncbi:PadR family transcriptional regulator [Anaerolentibacter hominis]|uniref:PadR family transcriptional regulator n=1 Tax=Anaerolentibacter hominis TaxID=3079009 RepID=UPI0031B82B47
MTDSLVKKYIPMTETTYYTLLAVIIPRHGYAIMQFVKQLTQGRICLGTGTLYTMVGRLVDDEMIQIVSEEGGRKTYQITEMGRSFLEQETSRLANQLENGREILLQGGGKAEEN